jgi:hypothetical protein
MKAKEDVNKVKGYEVHFVKGMMQTENEHFNTLYDVLRKHLGHDKCTDCQLEKRGLTSVHLSEVLLSSC